MKYKDTVNQIPQALTFKLVVGDLTPLLALAVWAAGSVSSFFVPASSFFVSVSSFFGAFFSSTGSFASPSGGVSASRFVFVVSDFAAGTSALPSSGLALGSASGGV